MFGPNVANPVRGQEATMSRNMYLHESFFPINSEIALEIVAASSLSPGNMLSHLRGQHSAVAGAYKVNDSMRDL